MATDRSVRYIGHMPRTADPTTPDRILSAVVPLFYRYGVRAVGMNQIIAAAGCGKNVLYRHFPTKTDLVAAYLDRTRAERERSARAAEAAAGDDPRARLLALVGEVADRLRDPGFRGCAMRHHLIEFPDTDDAPDRIARSYLAGSRARIDALAPSPAVADRIWRIVDGLYASAARPDAARQAATARAMAREVLAGA
jgi:AcrR family transcriptional regulator